MTDKKNKPPFYLIDTTADFYRPLGTRIVICAAAASWAALEIWHQQGFWGIISGAVAIYCVHTLIVTYSPPPKPEPVIRDNDPEEEDGAEGNGSGDDKPSA